MGPLARSEPRLGLKPLALLIALALFATTLIHISRASPSQDLGFFGLGKKKPTKPVTTPTDLTFDDAPPAGSDMTGGSTPTSYSAAGGRPGFGGAGAGLGGAGAGAGAPGGAMDVGAMINSPQYTQMMQQLGVPAEQIERVKKIMMDPAMQAKLRQLQQAFSNPQLIKDFQALTANDPRFAAMNEDMRLNGPQSMMKYMSDPEIMGKFSQIMQKYAPADLMQQSKAAQEAIKNGQIGFGGPNPTGAPEESPLIKAVLKGDVAEVEALCKSGKTNVNDKDPAGYTPILYAVMKKHTPVIKALIASGADVKAKGARGWGALHYAAGTTNDEAMELLLDNGADINERTDDGYLAFDIALKSPKHNPGSSSKIIQRLVPQDTITELHQAGRWCSLTKTKELLDQGKDLAQGDKAGMNAVHWAARQSDTPVFNALKENPQFTEKKLMESRDQFMNTPLHYAAGYNSKEIVLALLAMGADVNARNKNGHRPFTLASRDANAGILKDPVVGREMGIKLFGMAEPLKGVNPVSALTASQVNDTEAFKVAADKDNMVETDEEKRTAAHWAASFGNAEIMSKLIQENPAVLNMTDADGNTPLHVSCFKGNKLVTQLLCSSGAPRFSRNKDGQVPYDLARLRPKEDGDKEDILKCLAGMKI